MGFLRGQGGIEYLSNYTVAAAVVVIVLAAMIYLGVFSPSQPDICIFQKGLSCETNYLKQGNNIATVNIKNQFEDAIVIMGVICSGEQVDPGTALPTGRSWANPAPTFPQVNGIEVPANSPVVIAQESFELKTYCFSEKGDGMGALSAGERFKGIVFIKYRLNSSPNIPGSSFFHVIQGNLQGKMN